MLAYVLIQTAPGKFNGVLDNTRNFGFVLQANVIFGPADILAKIWGGNFDEIISSVREILAADDVVKTTTSLVVDREPEDLEKEKRSAYAYVLATATPKTGSDIMQSAKDRGYRSAKPTNCHYVLGEYDFIFEVQSDSLSDLKNLIQDIQKFVKGITGTTTLIVSPP